MHKHHNIMPEQRCGTVNDKGEAMQEKKVNLIAFMRWQARIGQCYGDVIRDSGDAFVTQVTHS